MKKLRKFLAAPGVSLSAFALAFVLLGFSTVGGARAAISYYSDPYRADVQLQQIEVRLVENGNVLADDATLLEGMVPEGQELRLGYSYPEALAVQNPVATDGNTNITEYVRVTVRRYWVDSVTGSKQPALDTDFIDLNFTPGEGWLMDEKSATNERTVLYYRSPLAPGQTTPAFTDALRIDPKVGLTVSQSTGADGVVTTTYLYNGKQFRVEAKADAVQNNNAADAMLSAWGVVANFDANGNIISLG